MGQSQSSSGDTLADTEQPLKRDYYELLSVERTATDEEIKKAYRRKALELHPDRNYGNEEGATRLFAEIQAAYEVLADPQERAWYDSHRDVLLRGETVGGENSVPGGDNFAYGSKMTSAEDVLKLMMKFNSRIQFSDAPSGFYGGLRDFFEALAKEEDIAAQWEDEESQDYPPFGSEDDDYEDIVRPFYAVWNGFATKKSYAWRDKWRLSDAPDRRIRRLMEKENKKLRDEAIFEFNDAVRSLVAFVRKRDPRVQNNQKSEAERQKALKELAAAQAARSRAQREAEIESFDLPEWARSRGQEPEEHAGGFSSEEEEEQHEYECVVCDKTFKSEKQFQAHEKSKRHIKSLKELKKEMKKEGKELNLGHQDSTSDTRPAEKNEGKVEDDAEVLDVQQESKPLSSNSEEERPKVNKASKSSTRQVHQPLTSEPSSEDDTDSDYAPRVQVERRLANNLSSSESDEDLSKLAAEIKSPTTLASRTDTPGSALSDQEDPRRESSPQPAKVGKAKQKRAKKAAAAAAATTSGDPSSSANGEFRCAVCGGRFTSKTKLFKHIDENNHAAVKSAAAAAASSLAPNQTKGGGGAKSATGGKAKKR